MVLRTGTNSPERLDGTALEDTLLGLAGDDTLIGFAGDDSIEGGADNDIIISGEGSDTLLGGSGDDTIYGGGGTTLNGTEVFPADPPSAVFIDSISGGDGEDRIVGGQNRNFIEGGADNDNIQIGYDPALSFADTIDGGTGADFMSAGYGADIYFVDDIGDDVEEATYDNIDPLTRTAEGDIDEVRSIISWTLGGTSSGNRIENLTLLDINSNGEPGDDPSDDIPNHINGTGNSLANVITGNSGDNQLNGGTGRDTLFGMDGNDTLIASGRFTGSEVFESLLVGGDGDDRYELSSVKPDAIVVEALNEGTDTIVTDADYTLLDNFENLELSENSDISGTGNAVANVITGNSGNNLLDGMEGGDTIIGGEGDDTLVGGEGDDSLTGGTGVDVFVFSPGGGDDVITDFEAGVDQLATSSDWGTTPTIVESADANGFRVFTFNGDTSVTLLNVLANQDPVFLSTGPTTANEDEVFTYNLVANDPDGDTLSVTEISFPDWISIVSGALTGTPTQDNVGTDGNDFRFVISDGNGGTATQEFTVDVLNVNDDPTFETTPGTAGITGIEYSYTPTFDDEDGDIPTVDEANSILPDWLTFDAVTGEFSGTPTASDTGDQDVTIAITDGMGGSATQTFTINVTAGNDAPEATDDTVTATEDTALIISDLLDNDSDPNLDTLTISDVTQGTLGSVVNNGDGTVTYTPNADENGSDMFTYTVSDGNGENDTATVNVTIDAVNDAPVITSSATTSATVGVLYSYTLTSTDAEDGMGVFDPLASTLPSWLTFDEATQVFSGTPAIGDIGESNVTINVKDTGDLMVEQTFQIAVEGDQDDFLPNHSGGADTTFGSVGYNTPVTGIIETYGDRDRFEIVLEAGKSYLISLEGASTGAGTLTNPALLGVFDFLGNALENSGDDDSGLGSNAQLDLNITETDQYQIEVGTPFDTALGSYRLTVFAESAEPTGAITITGTLLIGETLTANSTLADADGLGPFSYQWNKDGSPITGATQSTYLLTADDRGEITVTVSYTDGAGFLETVTSGPVTFDDARIIGTPDPDTLMGTAAGDTILGLGDDDTIDGGGGADTLQGGEGDDLYLLNDSGETVIELAGEGIDGIVSDVSFTLPDNVETLEFTGTSDVNGTGNALDNSIFGTSGANVLTGLEGSDTLNGLGGGDTLIGGVGDDLYFVTDVSDTLVEEADAGIDKVVSDLNVRLGNHFEDIEFFGSNAVVGVGNTLDNHIVGNEASNALVGSAGNDSLEGRDGDDVMLDGDGRDTLIGGLGNDAYVVGESDDVVIEAAADEGRDTVYSYAQSFVLPDNVEKLVLTDLFSLFDETNKSLNPIKLAENAESENPNLTAAPSVGDFIDKDFYASEFSNLSDIAKNAEGTGNALDNTIIGDEYNNRLSGLDGDDTIEGGLGVDNMQGGAGADTFRFVSFSDGTAAPDSDPLVGQSIDFISDFTRGVDTIDLSSLTLSEGRAAGNSAIAGLEIRDFVFVGSGIGLSSEELAELTGQAGSIFTSTDTLLGTSVEIVDVTSGQVGVPALRFAVATDAPLSAEDFGILGDVVETPDPVPLPDLSARFEDAFGSIGVGYTFEPVVGDPAAAPKLGIDAEVTFADVIDFGIGFKITIGAAYDQAPPADYDGPVGLGGYGGLGAFGSPAFSVGAAYNTGSFILSATYVPDAPVGAIAAFSIGDPGGKTVLDFDRDLDGAKDLELVLQGDFREAQFRSEIKNGDIEFSIHEGNSAPTGSVTIDGTPRAFENLEANLDNLFDRDGIDVSTLSFQWFNNGVAIDGATDADYRARLSDLGEVLNVQVSYTDFFGQAETVLSETTLPIFAVAGDPVGDVVITGTPQQGQVLRADATGVSDPDVLDPRTVIFQWQRDGVDIDGANDDEYQLTQDDVGAQISVVFSFTDLFGDDGSRTSVETDAVENVNDAATGDAVVSGDLRVGDTVMADLSGISDPDGLANGGAPRSFQWLRDGVAIAGATGETYELTQADANAQISVEVAFEDDLGGQESSTSAQAGPVTQIVAGETFFGDSSGNTIIGTEGDDIFLGLSGDDTIRPGKGNDSISGGPDVDTVEYTGDQSSYTIIFTPQESYVQDRRPDGDGTDRLNELRDVELLDFADELPLFGGQPVDLRVFGGPASLTAEEFAPIIELYIAYFNRAPDALGLYFWATAFTNGTTLEEMATLFVGQTETQIEYPAGTTSEAFAETVYNNVLGRTPDADGFNFWVGQLENQLVLRDAFILEVLKGAKADPLPGQTQEFIDQQIADRAYLVTKTDIGAYFSVLKGMSDVDNAKSAMAMFDGTDQSVTSTVSAIDAFFADALDPDTGEFLMQLEGVVSDPFAIV